MTDRADRQRLLAKVPMFGKLDGQELDGLLQAARNRHVSAGQELFHKGDSGSQVFVILSGRLKVMTTSSDGDDIVFGLMDPGEVFGELGLLLEEGTRTATIAAVDDCELLALDRRDFLPFLRSHPDAAIKLLEALAERLRRISEFVEDTLFLNLPSRLAKKLVALSQSYGREATGGVRIDLYVSQAELGDMVGTTRESINKLVRRWAREGLLSMEQGYITIHRPREIQALAGMLNH
ncbi:MAG: Crp/Fnr family transcriptional regulator [Myxococcota bacterium]